MMLRTRQFNEYFLTVLVMILAGLFLWFNDRTSLPFQDGTTVVDAAKDAVNVRVLLLAILDLHCVALIYFFGGHSFKIVKEFKSSPSGRIALGLLLAAWVIASSGVLHK